MRFCISSSLSFETIFLVQVVVHFNVDGNGHRPATTRSAAPPAGRSIPLGRAVSGLRQPSALAVGPDGQLYVADDGRNQVLQLVRGGKFRVVAGNGKRGFSGDGGRADAASLNDPGGLAVTRSGTLYIADTGNNRIRAVSPSGIISTVAGDRRRRGAWVTSGTPGPAASLLSPSDVAIGPRGALYIADTGYSEILKLAASGRLIRVAGTRRFAGVWGIGRPAAEASADGPDGLAFDRAGNLYIAGFNTKTLLEITSGGIMRLPDGKDGFYPRGPGGLAPAPNGSVLAMNGQQIDKITSRGLRILYTLPAHPPIGINGFAPDGIAVAANGTIYLDTYRGNGFAGKTALIAIEPTGKVRVIWAN